MAEGVYLDYASTSPLDPRVRDCMLTAMDDKAGFGNPSATNHAYGQAAGAMVATAAQQVAGLVNGDPELLVWTSGATESDNLAIIGGAEFRRGRGRHVIAVTTEHKAVLSACDALEHRGWSITRLQPDADGLISAQQVADAIRDDTTLVSVMHVNNETGVVQDIAAIGERCRAAGVLLHTDAVQSAGRLPLDMQSMNIDLLTVNAHKVCGPKGIGALLLNPTTIRRVEPLLFGGGQQRGMRPGTLPVHQIVGMGEAFRLLSGEMADEVPRLTKLREQLWSGLSQLPGVILNGHPQQRSASILTVSVSGVEGESLRFALRDIAVTSGSACNSATAEPSYVLRALGRDDVLAEASIRFSLGRFTTGADIEAAIDAFGTAVRHLRAVAATGAASEAA
ncbi:MAG: aminotransferase class V-fold PLP-dependent enzyme [Gammaproteobacteria bacterium]|nr:aminotransferase class V-fold PLP-dependent enzyme [Gammaproteobacteria bacterium]